MNNYTDSKSDTVIKSGRSGGAVTDIVIKYTREHTGSQSKGITSP